MTPRELDDQISAMSVGHICDVLECATIADIAVEDSFHLEPPQAKQKAMTALLGLLEHAEDFFDNADDHVGRFALGIAMNVVATCTETISNETTAKCIAENMESLAYILLVQMKEAGESWNPELVSLLRRIQHPSYNDDDKTLPIPALLATSPKRRCPHCGAAATTGVAS